MRVFNRFRVTRRAEAAALLLCLAFAAFIRFHQLESLPPGLYSDEAWYALDAAGVLDGQHAIYFPANNGREPLFIYLLSLSISALGHTPLAVRLPAALLGVLTVLAAYALGRALFNGRVGLLMAALTAGSLWALALSRIGLRATTLPPLAAFMVAAAVVAWRTRSVRRLMFAGALCGLCFYTYLSARLIPLPFIAFGVWWYSHRRLGTGSTATRLPWKELAAFGLAAALVAAPLGLYALREPQVYLGRAEQVSVLGSGWAALFDNLIKVLAMFAFAGDANLRHNLPGRPVFDWALSLAFFAGVGLALQRAWRREAASVLATLWCGTMLLPTLLSNEAPHFLRAIGALPMVFVFPALALDWLWGTGRWRLRALVVLAMTAGGLRTAFDYFGPYAQHADLADAFQTAPVRLAEDANAYLASGAGPLWLDKRLWDFAAARFLIARPAAVRLFEPGQTIDREPAMQIMFSPYSDYGNVLAALPERSALMVTTGALYRNEGEAEPYPLYVTFTVAPQTGGGPEPHTFERGIQLRAQPVARVADRVRVTLTWSVAAALADDVRVFIHLRRGEIVVSQADEPLGGVHYPVRLWPAGRWVTRAHELTLPAEGGPGELRLFVGLYDPAGARLRVDGGEEAVELSLP